MHIVNDVNVSGKKRRLAKHPDTGNKLAHAAQCAIIGRHVTRGALRRSFICRSVHRSPAEKDNSEKRGDYHEDAHIVSLDAHGFVVGFCL